MLRSMVLKWCSTYLRCCQIVLPANCLAYGHQGYSRLYHQVLYPLEQPDVESHGWAVGAGWPDVEPQECRNLRLTIANHNVYNV